VKTRSRQVSTFSSQNASKKYLPEYLKRIRDAPRMSFSFFLFPLFLFFGGNKKPNRGTKMNKKEQEEREKAFQRLFQLFWE
jgi:hypothetical protein